MSEKFELEKKMNELDSILENLENNEKSIDEQLIDYERGLNIIKECREYIENTEQKITNLSN